MSDSQKIDTQNLSVEEVLQLTRDYHELLNQAFPIESDRERVFARTLKLMEEMGEFANELLSKVGLQRQTKIDAYNQENLEDEFGDVLITVLLLGSELDIDISEVMKRKFALAFERMQNEIEQQEK
jgi:NTP pyrophosphatase (non-canonical NTP hydrolase)